MATETKPNDQETKADKTIAALEKAFEKDGTMDPGYTYRYRRDTEGNAVLVVEKKG